MFYSIDNGSNWTQLGDSVVNDTSENWDGNEAAKNFNYSGAPVANVDQLRIMFWCQEDYGVAFAVDNLNITTRLPGEFGVPQVTHLIMSADNAMENWNYTSISPVADWKMPAFSDATWTIGRAPFGTGATTSLPSSAATYYLRKKFTITTIPNGKLYLKIKHDDGVNVYLNGTEIFVNNGSNSDYAVIALTEAQRQLLLKGDNCLAVKWVNNSDSLSFDAGLYTEDRAHTYLPMGMDSENVVVYDDFENYSKDYKIKKDRSWGGYYTSRPTHIPLWLVAESSSAYNGDRYLTTWQNNEIFVTRKVTLEAGQTYTLLVSTKSINDSGAHELIIDYPSAEDVKVTGLKNVEWQRHKLEFSVPEGNEDVKIKILKYKPAVQIDDLILYKGSLNGSTISQADSSNGSFVVDKTEALVGENVRIAVNADEGFEISAMQFKNLATDDVTDIDLITKSFVMPNADVEVTATFAASDSFNVTVNGVDGLLEKALVSIANGEVKMSDAAGTAQFYLIDGDYTCTVTAAG